MSNHANESVALAHAWRFTSGSTGADESQLLALLDEVARLGNVVAAAREMGISYRHAWGVLRRWQAHFGAPLVNMQRGRGSELAPLGARLLAVESQTRADLASVLEVAARHMRHALSEVGAAEVRRLSIEASHDLLLTALADQLTAAGTHVGLTFRGNAEALTAFSTGRCDAAGLHCVLGKGASVMWSSYRALLRARAHLLIRVSTRRHGLLVAPGNPQGVVGLEDLQRKGLRFLNRQAGVGTRLVLDALLSARGLTPAAVAGYDQVAFTHGAITTALGEGQADAGMGIEATARRFGLGFVPLAHEAYFLAVRRAALGSGAMEALLAGLGSAPFREAAQRLGGYDTTGAGETFSPQEAEALLLTS